MDVSPCAFCELPHPRAQLRRDFELDICDRCASGGAEAELQARGHVISLRQWETIERIGKQRVVVHHLELYAHPRGSFYATATFTREGLLDRLVKLFRKELEVGDALFDDFVYIRTSDRPQVAELLKSSGAQATLMELVSRFGTVKIETGTFTLYERSDAPITFDAAAMLPICALLVHIDRALAGAA